MTRSPSRHPRGPRTSVATKCSNLDREPSSGRNKADDETVMRRWNRVTHGRQQHTWLRGDGRVSAPRGRRVASAGRPSAPRGPDEAAGGRSTGTRGRATTPGCTARARPPNARGGPVRDLASLVDHRHHAAVDPAALLGPRCQGRDLCGIEPELQRPAAHRPGGCRVDSGGVLAGTRTGPVTNSAGGEAAPDEPRSYPHVTREHIPRPEHPAHGGAADPHSPRRSRGGR